MEFNEIQAVSNVVKISPAKENGRTRFGEFRGSVRDVKNLLPLPKEIECRAKSYNMSSCRSE